MITILRACSLMWASMLSLSPLVGSWRLPQLQTLRQHQNIGLAACCRPSSAFRLPSTAGRAGCTRCMILMMTDDAPEGGRTHDTRPLKDSKSGRLRSTRTLQRGSQVQSNMNARSQEPISLSDDFSEDFVVDDTGTGAQVRSASVQASAGRGEGWRRDVVTVSPEFTALCQAQFEVLVSVLGASRCDLYFRREDPRTGQLEFVPAAVYPEKQRVWVVGEGPTGRPATGAIELAGFIPATSLLPEYPFVKTNREGGPSSAVEIKDGGLSVPIEYGSVVMGMLAVWREGNEEWTDAERKQVQTISTSLALAVVLDQKHQWQEAVQAQSLRKMLSETLHQVKNSLSAVRMFGKLLLRRLPAKDKMNRELARDILIQSDRLVDLLLPIDAMTRQASLAPAGAGRQNSLLLQGAADSKQSSSIRNDTCAVERAGSRRDDEGSMHGAALTDMPVTDMPVAATEMPDTVEGQHGVGGDVDFKVLEEDESLREAVEALRLSKDGSRSAGGKRGRKEVKKNKKIKKCRMDEALEPIISAGQAIAEFDGVEFVAHVAPKLPLVLTEVRVLQEAVSNVLDNALKYVLVRGDDPAPPRVSLHIQACCSPLVGVEVVIQDNGAGVLEEELTMLCEEGFRGQACRSIPGTGLGLHITKQLVELLEGALLLEPVSEGDGLRVRIQMPAESLGLKVAVSKR